MIMIRQGNNIYKWCETGDWLLCGKVIQGTKQSEVDYNMSIHINTQHKKEGEKYDNKNKMDKE